MAPTHSAGVREHFTGRFASDELETLSTLLGRLPGNEQETEDDCEPAA